MSLIARKSDLELEAQFISEHRMYLGNMVTGLFGMQEKLEPGSQAAKILDARIQQLQQADKMLEMQLNRINSQAEACDKEMQGAQKMVDQDIQESFGLAGQPKQ